MCLLPIVASAEGTTIHYTVNVDGGEVDIGTSEVTSVRSEKVNISSKETTVYVYGDYNPTYLYYPKVSEIHMKNKDAGALWDPTLEDLPNYLRAAVMDKAGVAILYDGYVDLDWEGDRKPAGVTREGEILGYDVYARNGEQYVNYQYKSGGEYSSDDAVTPIWSLIQLYRAVGQERVDFYVKTVAAPEDFDINSSPLVQYLSMATSGVDLSKAISNVYATRTNPSSYKALAEADLLPLGDKFYTETSITVSDFCWLAWYLMSAYGEPVITDQEIALLMQTYGKDLPYGLESKQLEAVKQLMARGIIDADLSWYAPITFETATTILMRIKDTDSRLTFKNIQLTMDVNLLAAGYYPVEVSSEISPIMIVGEEEVEAEMVDYYDYFVEFTEDIKFKDKETGVAVEPFVCVGDDYTEGILEGSSYLGTEYVGGRWFYHFQVKRADGAMVQYINTGKANDTPAYYTLEPSNTGGYFLITELVENTEDKSLSGWKHYSFDEMPVFGTKYVDEPRMLAATETSTGQLSIFNTSTYAITFRVNEDFISGIKLIDRTKNPVETTGTTLEKVDTGGKTIGDYTITRVTTGPNAKEITYTVKGITSMTDLTSILDCGDKKGVGYQAYPAIAKSGNQYLVSVELLKEMGVVWDFVQYGDGNYYLGVKSYYTGESSTSNLGVGNQSSWDISLKDITYSDGGGTFVKSMYTDVFINTGVAGNNPYAIRGSQLKIYDKNIALVVEQDNTYYVDYSVILGTTNLVGFQNKDGAMSLSDSAIPSFGYGTASSSGYNGSTGDTNSFATISSKYIYCPVTYALANWICVEDTSQQRYVFSFWTEEGLKNAVGEEDKEVLENLIGISVPDGWYVKKTPVYFYQQYGSYKDDKIVPLYWEEFDAFLIPFSDGKGKYYTTLTGNGGADRNTTSKDAEGKEIPAPAGVPGILGNPSTHRLAGTSTQNIRLYYGAKKLADAKKLANANTSGNTHYVIIHSTPACTWYQAATLTFDFIGGGLLSGSTAGSYTYDITTGDAQSSFDWEKFWHSTDIDHWDSAISIAIIAVLNILPRILAAFCVLLIGLAVISDVKPWQSFCESVFDPYKVLTFGRRDVHSIEVKRLVGESILALALFGLFQNGKLIEVMAWIASAVAGILNR